MTDEATFRLGEAVVANTRPGSVTKISRADNGTLVVRVQHDTGEHVWYVANDVQPA